MYNHILLATERYIAIRWPFRVAQLARIEYRVSVVVCWLGFVVGYSWPNIYYTWYDSSTGCVSVSYGTWVRWYSLLWTLISYPIPLVAMVVLNTLAVTNLRARGLSLVAVSDENARDFKRRASVQLQRTSVSLAVLFGLTSVFFQVTYTLQVINGRYWVLTLYNCLSVATVLPDLLFEFTSARMLCGLIEQLSNFCFRTRRTIMKF